MTGLLSNAMPKCPQGHGPMQLEPGFWALQGVERDRDGFALTGKGMVFKVWTCPVCKLAHIYADDRDA